MLQDNTMDALNCWYSIARHCLIWLKRTNCYWYSRGLVSTENAYEKTRNLHWLCTQERLNKMGEILQVVLKCILQAKTLYFVKFKQIVPYGSINNICVIYHCFKWWLGVDDNQWRPSPLTQICVICQASKSLWVYQRTKNLLHYVKMNGHLYYITKT